MFRKYHRARFRGLEMQNGEGSEEEWQFYNRMHFLPLPLINWIVRQWRIEEHTRNFAMHLLLFANKVANWLFLWARNFKWHNADCSRSDYLRGQLLPKFEMETEIALESVSQNPISRQSLKHFFPSSSNKLPEPSSRRMIDSSKTKKWLRAIWIFPDVKCTLDPANDENSLVVGPNGSRVWKFLWC